MITQEEADTFHHYLLPGGNGSSRIETYKIDEDFFCNYNNTKLSALYNDGKKPEGLNVLGVSDFKMDPISADDLVDMIKEAGNTMNVVLVEKLAKLFNYSLDGRPKEQKQEAEPPVPPPVEALPRPVETAGEEKEEKPLLSAAPKHSGFLDRIKRIFR